MPALAFENTHILYLPHADQELVREGYAWLRSISGSEDQLVGTSADLKTQMKYAGFYTRLWILCHGGNGSPNVYSTDGTSKTCSDLAAELVAGNLRPEIEVILWSCYGGAAGGAAQALWLNLRVALPTVRVGGVAGMTGSVAPGGALQLVSPANYKFRHGKRGDEALRATAQLSDLVFYPGAPTRSFEV